jgi:hypothetical protein
LQVINLEDHIANELARTSYTVQRRRLRWSTLGLASITILVVLFAALGIVPSWPVLLPGGLTLLSGMGLGYYEWIYRSQKSLRGQLRAGLAGQRLLPKMLANLDERYYLINNLKLPGRADDIDHIFVGPNGIFALETKHHRGRIFVQDRQWYQAKVSRSGRPQPEGEIRNPTQQLKRNVDYLRSCINRTDPALSRRTRLWIEGAVVFTHPAVSLDLPEEVLAGLPFPVLRARDLPAHILKHVPRHPYSRHDVRQIVSMFGHLQPGYPPCSDDPA